MLYARREPTTDAVLLKYAQRQRRFDVVLYADEACEWPYARWSWYKSPPRKGCKTVRLNGWKRPVRWLPDVPHPTAPNNDTA